MQVFKDAAGRDWKIEINLYARGEVLARAGIDFLDVESIKQLSDLDTLGRVFYALCREQIDEQKLTERQFAEAFKGDAFDRATAALNAELCDFFPSGKRQVMMKTLKEIQGLNEMALANAHEILDSGQLRSLMARQLKDLSGSLQAGSPSIPDPSHQDNS
jgi:hypothetical protein